ncbi:MAG: type II secretion system protein [Phycisphaerae bacterium]|nr:type II secretion system protein [Phycisphaerae bacterium]
MIIGKNRTGGKGFTLIELLVVISIIALLVSILMPALAKAKQLATAAVCLSNSRQLSMGWFMYQDDNSGRIMSSHSGEQYTDKWIGIPRTNDDDTNPGYCNITQQSPRVSDEDEIRGIKKGVLYPYLNDAGVYNCPGDKHLSKYDRSTVFVSYAIPACLNGHIFSPSSGKVVMKFDKIKNPSSKYVFVETTEQRNWTMAHHFVIASPEHTGRNDYGWWGPMAINHGTKSNLGYADGHAESRSWVDQYTIDRVTKLSTQNVESYGHEWPPADQTDDIGFMGRGWPLQYRIQ